MVMELINGPTLKDELFDLASTDERFDVAEAIRIVKSAAEALAYAHQRSMIHRDVKPANLMLDEDNRVVLTDFGIAKIVTGTQHGERRHGRHPGLYGPGAGSVKRATSVRCLFTASSASW
jgi:serine/threonine-protein kinase